MSMRSGSRSVFQFIPEVLEGVEVGDLCRPVEFSNIKLGKPCLYGTGFVHGGTVMLKRERKKHKVVDKKLEEKR